MSRDSMGRIQRLIAALGWALAASTIAPGQTVTTNYSPRADFSKYHTYQWVTTKSHTDADAEIQRSIDLQLAAKGLTKTDNKPDLTIDYRVAITAREKWSEFRYNEIDTMVPTLITVTAGTLGVEMHDPALNKIVWDGNVTKAMDPDASFATKKRNLDKALKMLFQRFPPKKSSSAR